MEEININAVAENTCSTIPAAILIKLETKLPYLIVLMIMHTFVEIVVCTCN